ncbi:MAG: DUF4101 domain-containing protein [Candidatus Melainabacteria bacterium]|nr:MAG: DUF4101 domain-containing protein [Candidatus Melainabacteria bacterium]
MRRRDFTTAFSLTVISSFLTCGAGFAADADPSLDQMFSDPAVTEKKAGGATESSSVEASGGAGSGPAPLCSIDALKQSALIKTGGWPGIGPFKGDGSEYVDAGQNRLKIESAKDKITSAELRLNNQNKNTAIFNLEMSADFLLESLGAKEARISDFNGQLEKSRVQLLQSSESKPLNLSAGSYVVNLHPEQDKTAADKYSFVIKVSSKDASSDLLKQHPPESATDSTDTDTTPSRVASNPDKQSDTTENGWETSKRTTTTTASKTPRTTIASPPGLSFGIETPKATRTTGSTPTKIATATPQRPPVTSPNTASQATASSQPTTTDSSNPDETSTAPAAPTSLKDTFREVIFNWQKLKKVAVRQRDTSELSTALSGKALIRQSDAIKWLQTNKKYYDMNPRSVVVDRYNELVKGQKYAVFAQVKESSKYMDEPTGQVIKDSEDTYNVNYTIEKSGDKWLISDSAIVTQPGKNKTR